MKNLGREELKAILAHPAIYQKEYWHSSQGRAIREVVFGMNDGIVSSVCFIFGVAHAISSPHIVLIAGLTEVFSGGISMFFGGYLSTKNQREFFEREIARERVEIEEVPDKERDEIRRIYSAKGFQGEELEMVVRRITSNKNIWLKTMMEEELGLIFESMDNPLKVGTIVGLAFILGAFVPFVPFMILPIPTAVKFSLGLTGLTLFVVGGLKTLLTKKSWVSSGVESLVIGLASAGAGFLLGKLAGIAVGQP